MVMGLVVVVVVVVEGIIVFVDVVVWLFGGLGGTVLRLLLLFPLFDCCCAIGIQAICLL